MQRIAAQKPREDPKQSDPRYTTNHLQGRSSSPLVSRRTPSEGSGLTGHPSVPRMPTRFRSQAEVLFAALAAFRRPPLIFRSMFETNCREQIAENPFKRPLKRFKTF